MSWDPTKPEGTESPGLFPTQGQNNWGRLQTIIEADHVFNTTADTDDGWHNIIHMIKQAATPSAVADANLVYPIDTDYTRSGGSVTAPHLFYRPSSGTDTNTFPLSVAPIRAFVNFSGTTSGNNAAQTIRSSYNISGVTRKGTSTGRYVVAIEASAVPTDGYAVMITGMASGGENCAGFVIGDVSYATSVTTAKVEIGFRSTGGNDRNVIMGNVIIVGG